MDDSPTENCELVPKRVCNDVARLVPKLTPKKNCVNVPQEICVRMRVNPRRVKRPVVKEWCSDDLTSSSPTSSVGGGQNNLDGSSADAEEQ